MEVTRRSEHCPLAWAFTNNIGSFTFGSFLYSLKDRSCTLRQERRNFVTVICVISKGLFFLASTVGQGWITVRHFGPNEKINSAILPTVTVHTEHIRIYIQNKFDTISNTICPYGAPPNVFFFGGGGEV